MNTPNPSPAEVLAPWRRYGPMGRSEHSTRARAEADLLDDADGPLSSVHHAFNNETLACRRLVEEWDAQGADQLAALDAAGWEIVRKGPAPGCGDCGAPLRTFTGVDLVCGNCGYDQDPTDA